MEAPLYSLITPTQIEKVGRYILQWYLDHRIFVYVVRTIPTVSYQGGSDLDPPLTYWVAAKASHSPLARQNNKARAYQLMDRTM